MATPRLLGNDAMATALGNEDILRSIMIAVDASNDAEVCRFTLNWSAVNKTHRRACKNADWTALVASVFLNAQQLIPCYPRANFYAMCMRAIAYRRGYNRYLTIVPSFGNDAHVRTYVLAAVTCKASALLYASEALVSDRSFIVEAVRLNPDALAYAPDRFQRDPELCRLATLAHRVHRWLSRTLGVVACCGVRDSEL